MSECDDVRADFGQAGILGAICWAYRSAVRQTRDEYSEPSGHNATWLGVTRHTLLCDRLDRVFACERHALSADAEPGDSMDQVFETLPDEERASMPRLMPDLVDRDDLNRSPGWVWGHWRWLLMSSAFGQIDAVRWAEKSPTKQRVARQPGPDTGQPTLFDDPLAEKVAVLEALRAESNGLDRMTLVVAHSLDENLDGGELVIGRPRVNAGGGPAWHWTLDLLALRPAGGRRGPSRSPLPEGPDWVPDATVRLRRPARDASESSGTGDQ